MATFYTGIDEQIYKGGDHYVPMEKFRLNPYEQKNLSYESSQPQSYGITNTNAFTNSGGGGGIGGNAFGYGTAIDPVAYGQYGAPGYEGGLPGDVQQYGVGRQFVGDELAMSPTGYNYSYKKEVPGWARFAAGFVPFGNTALNFIENRMNQNRGTLSGYKMAGLNEIEKGAYNQLAGQGMLFEGSTGLKTLTGKNFGAKGYFEGQEELAKEFGFDQMTPEEIEAAIEAEGLRHSKIHTGKGFKYKQMKEAAAMAKYREELLQDEIKKHNEAAAATINQNQTGSGDGGGGHVRTPGTYDTDTSKGGSGDHRTASSTSFDKPSRHHALADGGRIGYKRGRVVNPGGYAGDEEGGIVEWLKSKMGIESETNPTMFGTQDSLLNRGSIDQLKNAIKSYEAMMHMGELDEEQLADYELKLAQLQALEEGAQSKADGGIVGFKYGGLASIL